MKVNHLSDLVWPDDQNYEGQCQPLPVQGNVVAVMVVNRKNAFTTILHESVHVWQGIMEYIAESNPGIETEAYTIEYITTTLMREYEHLTGETLAIPKKRKARLQA
jgi:hypothetical protein